MAEEADSSSSSKPGVGFLRRYYEGWKESWAERFDFMESFDKIYFSRGDKPYKPWTESDISEFIASDPVHGPTLKLAREAAKVSLMGSIAGAFSTAGVAWKYSRSPHGAALAFGTGAVCGWLFTQEFASHWMQLYRVDTMASQVKFYEWWVKKTEGGEQQF